MSLDPSIDILHLNENRLNTIFFPKSVAIIGASEKENSVGRTLVNNIASFKGKVFFVNPKHDQILGRKSYPSILKIGELIDLAIIAVPAPLVPKIIEECVLAKVSSAIIISSGFREIGEEGLELENKIKESSNGKIRIIGPNCLGIMNPIYGFNGTFAADMALKGNIAFISQSGALCTAVLDWSLREKIGFSAFVSIGSMLDIQWSDLIYYFGNDPNTKSILIYMESLGNARDFLSAAKEVALTKPIILIKAGKTKESMHAAISHTGALAERNDIFDAALKRVGVLRVDTIADLFDLAEILSRQPFPKGPNLSIITNAGGPAVISVDALIQSGGKLTNLSSETISSLDQFLPRAWSHNNPIDILGDASAETYAKTLKIVEEDPNTDGILIILTPQNMTDPLGVAKKISGVSKKENIPILASWMGGKRIEEGCKVLAQEAIANFEYPDNACKTFSYMWKYSNSLSSLYETPNADILEIDEAQIQNRKIIIEKFIEDAIANRRFLLNEYESKKIIEAYNIPINPTFIAKNLDEAISLSKRIGFPLVLKVFSNTITHKKAFGGVKLNLKNEHDLQNAYNEIYEVVKKELGESHFQGVTVQTMVSLEDLLGGFELILGSISDPIFGPVLLFGSGGHLVEILKDSALALPPLNTSLALKVMKSTKIFEILKSKLDSKDLELLTSIFVQFSNLIVDYPIIKEIDINPLFVFNKKIVALDARIVLHEKKENIVNLAIRPYPIQYVKHVDAITLRPLKPEDSPLMVKFLDEFSDEVLERFLKNSNINRDLIKDKLSQLCFKDYDREICIIAKMKDEFLGLAKLIIKGSNLGSFSVIVKDKWKNNKIGTNLIAHLIDIGKRENLAFIRAEIARENIPMIKICSKLNFKINENKEVVAEYIYKS